MKLHTNCVHIWFIVQEEYSKRYKKGKCKNTTFIQLCKYNGNRDMKKVNIAITIALFHSTLAISEKKEK